jgi:hypothetical protein
MARIVFLAALLLVGACGTLQQKPAAVSPR